jgi:hypothetical protein
MNMSSPFCGLLLLAFAGPLSTTAQDLTLKPDWRKGDLRTVYVTSTQRTVQNGEVLENIQERSDAKVRVMNVEGERWMLEVDMPNPVVRVGREATDKLGSELDPFKRMQLRLTVEKATGSTMVFNWVDLREKVNGAFDQMKRTLRKSDPETLGQLEARLAGVLELYNDSLMLTGTMLEEWGFLTRFVAQPLSEGGPLELRETPINPFDPKGQPLVTTTRLYLDAYDRQAGRATVRAEQTVDEAAFKETMRRSMMQVVEAMGGDKNSRAKAAAQADKSIAAMRIEVTREETHQLDTQKGWPVRVTGQTQAMISADGVERRIERQRNVELR